MKYLYLLYGPDGPLPEPGTPEHRQLFEQWSAATGAMAQAGVLIDCGPLQPAAMATTVRVRRAGRGGAHRAAAPGRTGS